MIQKIIGWFIHRKFVDQNGEYFYKGISVTKVGIVVLALMKAVEGLTATLAANGLFHAIAIPAGVYEIVATITGLAARDALAHPASPQP